MWFLKKHCLSLLLAVSSFTTTVDAAKKIKHGADPTIMKSGGYYYSASACGNNNICVRKASTLVGLGNGDAQSKTAWKDSKNMGEVWAPEIAQDGGKTYVYFAAGRSDAHRMYVISADDPMGNWSSEKKINLSGDEPAIDGLMFKFEGQRWFVWSGWKVGNNMQNIYLSRMTSPTNASGPKYLISQPRESWELRAGRINEAPEVIIDPNGQLHITYSANGSWNTNYCIADLRLKKGGKPDMTWHWFKSNGCLFGSHQRNMMSGWSATKTIDGPGHHTFQLENGDPQKSPGGTNKIPFVFHGVPKGTEYKWSNRGWYTGSYVWWSNTKYRRGGSNAAEDTGYSFRYFE